MNDYFVTMKEIGAEFGVTSHAIGKKLKEHGLRTADGKPSSRAFDEGYCDQKFTQDYSHYLWAWHLGKTITVLEAAGMKRVNALCRKQSINREVGMREGASARLRRVMRR